MKLRRRAPTPPQETIITLIDVVFFLLVFFMLIGRMDATAPFETAPPLSKSGADMPAGGITVSVSEEGAFALDSVPIERNDLLGELSDLPEREKSRLIRVNAHKNSELRHVLPLVSNIENIGFDEVVLVVTPNESP